VNTEIATDTGTVTAPGRVSIAVLAGRAGAMLRWILRIVVPALAVWAWRRYRERQTERSIVRY
jgi:hypothetical protein